MGLVEGPAERAGRRPSRGGVGKVWARRALRERTLEDPQLQAEASIPVSICATSGLWPCRDFSRLGVQLNHRVI